MIPWHKVNDFTRTAKGWGIHSAKTDFKIRTLEYLIGAAAKLADEGAPIEYGAHTLVKLIALASYSNRFCTIANSEKTRSWGYDASVYLDLFAGPGLVKIAGLPDLVAGSPIAADSSGIFDLAVLVEKRKNRADILRKRMGKLLPPEKFEVIEGDCNERIGEVVKAVKDHYRHPIVLAFIDPEGLDIHLETLATLSKEFPSADFIINVTGMLYRVQGKILDGDASNRPKFDKFVGEKLSSLFLAGFEGHELDKKYQELVLPVLGRPLQSTIPVYLRGEQLLYTLIFCTRKSETGSPWIGIWNYIAEKLRGCDEAVMEQMMDAAKGRTTTLPDFFS